MQQNSLLIQVGIILNVLIGKDIIRVSYGVINSIEQKNLLHPHLFYVNRQQHLLVNRVLHFHTHIMVLTLVNEGFRKRIINIKSEIVAGSPDFGPINKGAHEIRYVVNKTGDMS